jgi:acyl-[acyl carrier protein]--UDP-N-acetylglucosamine O-acyltransferase
VSNTHDGATLSSLLEQLPEAVRRSIAAIEDPSELAPQLIVGGARALDLANADDMVFCKALNGALLDALRATRSRIVIAPIGSVDQLDADWRRDRVVIETARPRATLAALAGSLPVGEERWRGRDAAGQRIAPDAKIGPGVVLGADVEIRSGVVIGPNSVIHHATIGARSRIGANCSIGGDGFGFEMDPDTGEVIKFPHFGRVVIGEDVEIFANVCVARGSLRDTVIERDVKIDNLVHVAHNCVIGAGTFVIANSMLGGSVTIGQRAWIAPSTSILNGLNVGDGAMTGMGAAVVKHVAPNELVAGVPAKKLRDRVPASSPT